MKIFFCQIMLLFGNHKFTPPRLPNLASERTDDGRRAPEHSTVRPKGENTENLEISFSLAEVQDDWELRAKVSVFSET